MIAVNGCGAIAMINDEAERLFGCGRKEWLGPPVEIMQADKLRGQHAT